MPNWTLQHLLDNPRAKMSRKSSRLKMLGLQSWRARPIAPAKKARQAIKLVPNTARQDAGNAEQIALQGGDCTKGHNGINGQRIPKVDKTEYSTNCGGYHICICWSVALFIGFCNPTHPPDPQCRSWPKHEGKMGCIVSVDTQHEIANANNSDAKCGADRTLPVRLCSFERQFVIELGCQRLGWSGKKIAAEQTNAKARGWKQL